MRIFIYTSQICLSRIQEYLDKNSHIYLLLIRQQRVIDTGQLISNFFIVKKRDERLYGEDVE